MGKSLKSINQKWMWSVVALDVAACIAIAAPTLLENPRPSYLFKSLLLPAAPVIVLLLTSLLSSNLKASLVYLRLRDVYPGCRAYTEIGPTDGRFTMADLEKNVGSLPSAPAEQNAHWYKLFKKVEAEITVNESHQHFLLLRDLAAMSLVLIPVAFTAGFFAGLGRWQLIAITFVFAAQCVVALIGANNSGKRMVANVMCLHALKKRR